MTRIAHSDRECSSLPANFDFRNWSQDGQSQGIPLDSFISGDSSGREIIAPYLNLMNEAYWQKIAEDGPSDSDVSDTRLRFAIGEAVRILAERKSREKEKTLFSTLYELFIERRAHAEPFSLTVLAILVLAGVLGLGAAGCVVTAPTGPWDDDTTDAGGTDANRKTTGPDAWADSRGNDGEPWRADGQMPDADAVVDGAGQTDARLPDGNLDGAMTSDAYPPDVGADATRPVDARGPDAGADAAIPPDAGPLDTDGDGVTDDADNCPLVSNADQQNLDGDELGDACDVDADGDGFDSTEAGGGDCDDGLASTNPSAREIPCDGTDNDCAPATPDTADGDGDGFNCVDDCNDGAIAINPNATEAEGDGIDNNCDGYEHAWTRQESIGENDSITSLAANAEGGVWATGFASRSGENTNAWCDYTGADGRFTSRWTNTFNAAGRDMGNGVILDTTGENLLIAGMLTFDTRDGVVWRTPAVSPLAEPVRLYQFDGDANLEDTSNDVLALEDGGYVIVSSLTNNVVSGVSDMDIDIRRVDGISPEPIWRLTFGLGNGQPDKGLGLLREPGSDTFYAVGRIAGRLWLGEFRIDTGSAIWQRPYDTIETRDANTKRILAFGEDGNLQVAAEQRTPASGLDAYLYTVNPANGDILSTMLLMDTATDDWSNALLVDGFGNRIVAGAYGGADANLMIIDPEGEILWQKIINGDRSTNDSFTALSMNEGGRVFAGGYVNAVPGDSFLMRLDPR